MHKVVKSALVFREDEAVYIDNTVKIEVPPVPETEEPASDEARIEEQRRLERQRGDFLRNAREQVEAERQELIRQMTEKERIVLSEAEEKARAVRAMAEQEAAEIRANAEDDAIKIKERARLDGHEEGYQAGHEESIERCREFVKAAAQFLAGINARKEAYYQSHEEEIEAVVLEMVKKITMEEISANPQIIHGIIRQGAKEFKNDSRLKISVAKGEVSEELISDPEFLRSIAGDIADVEIEILPDAKEGTVILDNGEEILDASVPTQLEFLKEIMENSRRKQNE